MLYTYRSNLNSFFEDKSLFNFVIVLKIADQCRPYMGAKGTFAPVFLSLFVKLTSVKMPIMGFKKFSTHSLL